MNCSAPLFRPNWFGTGASYAVRAGDRARCSALYLGGLQVLHTMQRAAVPDAIAASGESNDTVVRLIDRSEPINPYRIEDGTHLDDYDLICLECALQSFWAMF